MMELEQVTIPDGIVNGPDRVLPRKCVFNGYYNSMLRMFLITGDFTSKTVKGVRFRL